VLGSSRQYWRRDGQGWLTALTAINGRRGQGLAFPKCAAQQWQFCNRHPTFAPAASDDSIRWLLVLDRFEISAAGRDRLPCVQGWILASAAKNADLPSGAVRYSNCFRDQSHIVPICWKIRIEERNVRYGIYRIPGVGDQPNDVRVDDDGISVPLEESLYRARGYSPLADDLPWHNQYLLQQALVLSFVAEQRVNQTRAVAGAPMPKARSAAIFRRYERP
jgi:hypothetical protein